MALKHRAVDDAKEALPQEVCDLRVLSHFLPERLTDRPRHPAGECDLVKCLTVSLKKAYALGA